MDGHFQKREVEVGDARGSGRRRAVAHAEHVGEREGRDLWAARDGRQGGPVWIDEGKEGGG